MSEIVTLEKAKAWLRVDGNDEDDTITTLIAAGTEAVLAIAEGYDPTKPTPVRIELAILSFVAKAYGEREDGVGLPDAAAHLVSPFRVLDI